MIRRTFLATAGAAALTTGCSGDDYAARAEARYPPLGRYVDVDGVRVHYWAEGSGPSVILIHGANGNLRDWTFSMAPKLARNHRVIAFDRPGHGYSGRPENGDDPEVQAAVLSRAATSLGVERAVIVGQSWGGSVAAAWALNAPEQVAGVVMIAGATYPWGGSGVTIYELGASDWAGGMTAALARIYLTEDQRAQFIRDVFHPNPPDPGYEEYIGAELATRPDTFHWNSEDIANLNGHLERMAPRYGQITAPVEIIHGEADQTVLASVHSLPLAQDVAEANLTLLPGVGHMPHHVEEARVIAAIERLTGAGGA